MNKKEYPKNHINEPNGTFLNEENFTSWNCTQMEFAEERTHRFESRLIKTAPSKDQRKKEGGFFS